MTTHNKLQSLGTVSSTAQAVHWDQLLQQLLLSAGNSMDSSGTNWTDSSSRSNLTARPTRLLSSQLELPSLSWNSTCLWAASHCSVLSWAPGSGLKCLRVDRKQITDRPWWSVTVDSLPREREAPTSLVSAVAVNYRGYLIMSRYCETRHSIDQVFSLLKSWIN
jgi:hypothetical protein